MRGLWRCGFFLSCLLLPVVRPLFSAPLVSACSDDVPRKNCGAWAIGAYYSVSPVGDWFSGISYGFEYYVLTDTSIGVSFSPGFGDGYFYIAPSVEANYYLWHNPRWDVLAGYSFRYFYDWPFRRGESESQGTFHGPGVSVLYGFTEQLYAGANISYQWIRFAGENYREWYFTVPLFWIF